jgi:mannose-1-phosphate guanylyltransferase
VLEAIPETGPSDFGKDVFPSLLASGRHLHAVLVNGYLRDTGTPENYRRVNEDALTGKFPGARGRLVKNPPSYTLIGQGARFAPDVTFRGINVIGAKVKIESKAVLTDCIVWDNAVIGENVVLTDALIGYRAVIRASSHPPDGLRLGDDDVYPEAS